MKCYMSVLCVLSALLAVSLAAPATIQDVSVHHQVKRQAPNSETVNRIISYSNNKLQMLRRLFPQLFQIIDIVIQNATSQVFRIVGGALLRSGGLGGGGGGGGGGGRVSVVLPTFPPDEDDDEDLEDDEDDVDIRNRISDSSASSTDSTSAANPLNAIITSSDNEIAGNDNSTSTVSSTVADVSSTTEASSESPQSPFTSPSMAQDNNNVKRNTRTKRSEDDQDSAASGGNGPDPASDLSNVDTEDADRNKRFLPFGGDKGSGGGSGNFLFDLIRNTADRAARTVGTVYRMVAGTENLGLGISATASKTVATAPASQLVAGSGTSEAADEKEAGVGGVAEVDIAPKSGDLEGVPGPITRLLVIANRGIANLIQDLILRLAQTSERIVNFKARLITSLI